MSEASTAVYCGDCLIICDKATQGLTVGNSGGSDAGVDKESCLIEWRTWALVMVTAEERVSDQLFVCLFFLFDFLFACLFFGAGYVL